MSLAGKAAVVTGSSHGVGRATALRFAREGCDVIINYTRSAEDAAEVEELCSAAGARAIAVRADISRDEDCRRLVQAAEQNFGRLDILVNNAGYTRFVAFADLEGLTEEIWDKTLRTNLMGSFFCTRAAVPLMRKSGGGAVVNVASVAGILGIGSSVAYAASKAAMINMTKALARALGPEIRLNAVAPGAIDTRWLREGLGEKGYAALAASLHDTTPLRDVSSPEDIADAIVWLAQAARMVTGEVIIVDGGYHLGPDAKLAPRRDRTSQLEPGSGPV